MVTSEIYADVGLELCGGVWAEQCMSKEEGIIGKLLKFGHGLQLRAHSFSVRLITTTQWNTMGFDVSRRRIFRF
jgi:hypothetical protein